MRPILFDFSLPLLGKVTFPAYFTLLTIGFGLAMVLTVRESRRLGMDHERILDTNLWMVVMGIVGARLLHLIADGHFHDYLNLCVNPKAVPAIDALVQHCSSASQCGYDYLCDTQMHKCYPPQDCLAAIKVWRGGLAYYGGFLVAVPFAYWYVKRHALGWWRTADLAAPGIMLGLFFGRLGCFLNGCCYGKETDSPLGIVFPVGSDPWRAQFDAHLIAGRQAMHAVHPTQLYESLGCFLAFMILYYVIRPNRRAYGQVFGWMLILYAVVRSVCEIWRNDDRGVFTLPLGLELSTSQLISLPLFVGGAILLVATARHASAREATARAA